MTNVEEITSILCYRCKYCCDDIDGAYCCLCMESKHFTRNWDLPVELITECNCFKEK